MGVLQPANWARPLEPWLVGARARQSGLPIFCGSGRPTRTALGCFRSLALEGLSAPCRSSRTSWYRRGKCVLVLLALAIVKILDMASCLRACTGRRGRLSRRGRWRRGASLPPRLFTGSSARLLVREAAHGARAAVARARAHLDTATDVGCSTGATRLPPCVSNAARRAAMHAGVRAPCTAEAARAGPSGSMSYKLEKPRRLAPEAALQQRRSSPREAATQTRTSRFLRREPGTAAARDIADARRNALRRGCGKRARRSCIAARCAAEASARRELRAERRRRTPFVTIDTHHAGVQRITAARGVEARFVWKRFWRSRNDARP